MNQNRRPSDDFLADYYDEEDQRDSVQRVPQSYYPETYDDQFDASYTSPQDYYQNTSFQSPIYATYNRNRSSAAYTSDAASLPLRDDDSYPRHDDGYAQEGYGQEAYAMGPYPVASSDSLNQPLTERAPRLPPTTYYDSYDAFEPYQEDEEDPDANNFAPFPIAGETYALNTFQGEHSDEEPPSPFADPDSVIPPPPDGEQVRRNKTMVKKVQMINGNLVLDCPVSQKLLAKYPEPLSENDREFLFMRYQAATCDPDDFESDKFTLRQKCYKQPRQTELMIVVTMYNEDDVLLARTLKGVFKNIKYLMGRKRSSTWGQDAWKKVVVCIVSDGRMKINPRARALLAALGGYQEGFAKNMVNDKEVKGHIYEYTTMVGISSIKDDVVKLTTEKTVPVQLLFCLKEKNQKKINSHRWCFQAFGPILNPNVVILLDAGTQPKGDSIYHLWKSFDKDPGVAGACGEIKAMLGPKCKYLLNPIVAAQNFEYKTSNILDKPMESVFGFVTVLPGAFSAYRYVALQNDVNGSGPLEKYFKGETLHDTTAGIFTSNMYLAEDRILCFELVAKRDCSWKLKYVKSAAAATDVPDRLHEFILQRRRWLNGSFFAAIYSVVHFYKLYKSSHSIGRKLFLHVQFLYQILSLVVSWFSIGSFFLVFRILTVGLGDASMNFAAGNILSVIFLWFYLVCIVTTFVLSFGNRPKGTNKFYIVIVSFFAILMGYMIFAAIYMAVKAIEEIIQDYTNNFSVNVFFTEARFRDLVVATVSTYVLYFLGSFLYLDPWHMFTCFVQYILLSPAYINVLNIYAFCNIHDISWGTKGDTGKNMDLGVAKASASGQLEVDIPTFSEDIDNSYSEQINILLAPPSKDTTPQNADEKQQDYYAFIRSMTVLFWMFSNFVIIAVVLQTGGVNQLTSNVTTDSTGYISGNSTIYLTVILWIVAFMALFRFLGCTAYILLWLIGK